MFSFDVSVTDSNWSLIEHFLVHQDDIDAADAEEELVESLDSFDDNESDIPSFTYSCVTDVKESNTAVFIRTVF